MTLKRTSPAFTLIEAIVYFALLAFLLTGALLAAYQMLQGQGHAQTRNTAEDEGGFVVRKIEWALGTMTSVSEPSAATPYSTRLDMVGGGGMHIVMRLHSGALEMSEDSGTTYLPLITSNVSVSSLHFHYLAPAGGGPLGVEASTTLDGEEFDAIRYAR